MNDLIKDVRKEIKNVSFIVTSEQLLGKIKTKKRYNFLCFLSENPTQKMKKITRRQKKMKMITNSYAYGKIVIFCSKLKMNS